MSTTAQAASENSYKCHVCIKTFSRPDHLHRHFATHSQHKPYACKYCGKRFARRDAAQRHEDNSHLMAGRSGQTKSRPSTKRRACASCATARISCPGGEPCANCQQKGLVCVYYPRKRTLSTKGPPSEPAAEAGFQQDSHGQLNGSDRPEGLAESLCAISSTDSTSPSQDARMHAAEDATFLSHSTIPLNWLPFDSLADLDNFNLSHPDDIPPPLIAPGGDSSQARSAPVVAAESDEQQRSWSEQEASMATLIAAMGPVPKFHTTLRASGHPTRTDQGMLYATGDGSRISQAERSIRDQQQARIPCGDDSLTTSAIARAEGTCDFQALEQLTQGSIDEGVRSIYTMPDRIYEDIVSRANSRAFVLSDTSIGFPLGANFPSKNLLNYFIRLYFDHFHPVHPFLDQPLFSMPAWGWSPCLAASAIGCRYAPTFNARPCSDALNLVLHEMLVKELDVDRAECTLPHLQALLLNVVGLLQSTQSALISVGKDLITSVMHLCFSLNLFDEVQTSDLPDSNSTAEQAWLAWRCRETRRRTGIFAWIIDCSVASMEASPPTLNLQKITLRLPSSESLWEATSVQEWCRLYVQWTDLYIAPSICLEEETGRSTFLFAISTLFRERRLVENVSQFARVALIYALEQRKWDTFRYFHDPLSIPTNPAQPEGHHQILDISEMTKVPEFRRWRNAACDYLDVLHWDALSTSLKNGGLEGPIFLQLHLARLLLLTPVKELLGLMDFTAQTPTSSKMPHRKASLSVSMSSCQHKVITWASKDHYKARLAVIHAGATFWHVRRYSSDSFVQPFAIYLAALTLHYFSITSTSRSAMSTSRSQNQTQQHFVNHQGEVPMTNVHDTVGKENGPAPPDPAVKASSEEYYRLRTRSRMPRHCHIDRPIDDEFVQYFIRNGESAVTLCAEAVEDLCTPQGATQILVEAAALLKMSASTWPAAEVYAMSLEAAVALAEPGPFYQDLYPGLGGLHPAILAA